MDSFKQCLEYDYQSFKEASDDKISDILSGKHNIASDKFLLPQDILLKFIALSILPSHSLRQLGMYTTNIFMIETILFPKKWQICSQKHFNRHVLCFLL